MPQDTFGEWAAQNYETLWPHVLAPELLDRAVDFLVDLAGDGAALEFAIGTGRLGNPLHARGVRVAGIEISTAMAARVDPAIPVTIGDMATVRVDGSFNVVYLVRNTITNLNTQAEQVACFRNAATHLVPGGCFVIENYIPNLQRIPPGETTVVFDYTAEHLGFEEYDFANQIAISHHYWMTDDGIERRYAGSHRYVWPGELDLMAELAGLTLRERWNDWERAPFTSTSSSHVSVWQKPA